jgi:hypothetical protein
MGMIRRGCARNCLGCLIPVIVILALVAFAVHLCTSPPDYSPVVPAPLATVELAEAEAVATALANGEPVALLHLTDAEATGVLRDSIGSYDGLSNLEVHVLQGHVVVSGETSVLNHPLVISGPVTFKGQGEGVIELEFSGLSIGRMPLPTVIPQTLSRDFHPALDLTALGAGRPLTFACEAARPNDLTVGVSYGQGTSSDAAVACTTSS